MVYPLIYVVALLLAFYLGWGVILYVMQPKFLYCPIRAIPHTPAELDLDFEDVTIRTTDGLRLTAWYIPAKDAQFTLLFCHGNGGNMMHRLDSIEILHNLGLSCLIFDYRGYGNSEGKPSEQGTYLDAAAAYEWLTAHRKIPPNNIIIFGRSLGGSIAAHLAARVGARGLVVESSFTSYVEIGRKFYPYMPVKWFARFGYRTIDYVKNVHCPLMFIYSRNDELVPFEFGRELFDAANEPKEFVEIFGSHNDGFLVSGEAYRAAWAKWLKSVEGYEGAAVSQQAS